MFFVAYALILWMAPKELPPDTLNVSINGETVQHYQRARGECARTKIAMDALIKGLGHDGEIKVNCIRQEVVPQQ